MAINKNAFLRYQVLDKCFRNPGRKYFWEDLLEACNQALSTFNGQESNISRRQLFDDIRFLESEAGGAIPLKKVREGKRIYYRYEDLNFSINNQPLNESDLNLLQSGMQILARFKGIPQLDGLTEIILKLQKGRSPQEVAEIVGYDHNPFLKGIEYISTLFQAILYRQVVNITYQDFKSNEPYEVLFHPYYLKQYNRRWFVLGYNPIEEVVTWNFALDRIKAIEPTNAVYRPNTIDWEEYFEDIIGVTKPADAAIQEIVLWFAPETAPYILTKPIHGSQRKIHTDENGLTIQLKLIPNFELVQTVLSFGDRVKVLAPDTLQTQLRAHLSRALQRYL